MIKHAQLLVATVLFSAGCPPTNDPPIVDEDTVEDDTEPPGLDGLVVERWLGGRPQRDDIGGMFDELRVVVDGVGPCPAGGRRAFELRPAVTFEIDADEDNDGQPDLLLEGTLLDGVSLVGEAATFTFGAEEIAAAAGAYSPTVPVLEATLRCDDEVVDRVVVTLYANAVAGAGPLLGTSDARLGQVVPLDGGGALLVRFVDDVAMLETVDASGGRVALIDDICRRPASTSEMSGNHVTHLDDLVFFELNSYLERGCAVLIDPDGNVVHRFDQQAVRAVQQIGDRLLVSWLDPERRERFDILTVELDDGVRTVRALATDLGGDDVLPEQAQNITAIFDDGFDFQLDATSLARVRRDADVEVRTTPAWTVLAPVATANDGRFIVADAGSIKIVAPAPEAASGFETIASIGAIDVDRVVARTSSSRRMTLISDDTRHYLVRDDALLCVPALRPGASAMIVTNDGFVLTPFGEAVRCEARFATIAVGDTNLPTSLASGIVAIERVVDDRTEPRPRRIEWLPLDRFPLPPR